MIATTTPAINPSLLEPSLWSDSSETPETTSEITWIRIEVEGDTVDPVADPETSKGGGGEGGEERNIAAIAFSGHDGTEGSHQHSITVFIFSTRWH